MSEATKERKELAAPSGSAECDNSFVSVLWRRLHSDLRRPSGWGDDLMEPYFRAVVERTLKEFPPNIVLNNTEEAASDEAREKAERYRLEANAMMAKLHELQTYADKLADGLPAGMLPRDVENLREANAGLAEDLQNAERERDEAILELGAIQATIAETLNLPRTPLTAADVHAALNHLTQ